MLTFAWYFFSSAENRVMKSIYQGSRKAAFLHYLVYVVGTLEALAEFTAILTRFF